MAFVISAEQITTALADAFGEGTAWHWVMSRDAIEVLRGSDRKVVEVDCLRMPSVATSQEALQGLVDAVRSA